MNETGAFPCRAAHAGFFARAAASPDSVALEFADAVVTYGELGEWATRIALSVSSCEAVCASPWVGMLVGKRVQGYAAIFGILAAGKAYMPLSCAAPAARSAGMIARAGSAILVADDEGVQELPAILERVDRQLAVLVAVSNDAQSVCDRLAIAYPSHRFVPLGDAVGARASLNVEVDSNAPAYLLFTSGSTGRPKGVMVSHGNVRHFLDVIGRTFAFSPDDRFSQTFDFTFDLSVFDIFVSLEAGATLCVPSDGDKVLPRRYIARAGLTVWFSVPSIVTAMQAARQLHKGAFTSLRHSLFCGEALVAKAARAWIDAAPNASLVNLYGPTEATICCMGHRWDARDESLGDEQFVPIGRPFDGLGARVLDERMASVVGAGIGELWIGGPQVALGYLDSDAENARRFVRDEVTGERFYCTGDRVFRDNVCDELRYVGRSDHQVKIRGYRIELAEVEQALRACTNGANAIAVPWPPQAPHEKLIAVLDAAGRDTRAEPVLRRELLQKLPGYMLPDSVVYFETFPLNSNGKIDRRAVAQQLAERAPDH